ncbi:UDP-glycosyltransferase 76C2-like [Tasmannia lanceolata]|uniref:UDP-glycosyltransferase 76C2-like n=1 Tax=Tasmannia lanceolata TaxID=3420 RepID=UPI004064900D
MTIAEERKVQQEKKGRRIVLFPSPLQGHITPMLQLATLLLSKGFSITIVHTRFNSPNPSNYPEFNFEPISDGLPNQKASDVEFMALFSGLNVSFEAPFRDMLDLMLLKNTEEPIVCIVEDGLMQFVQRVADHLKLPRMILETNSVASLVAYTSIPLLRQKGYIPSQDPMSKTPITELPPLRIKDIPVIKGDNQESLYELVVQVTKQRNTSSGFIWNSFDYLERTELSKIQQCCQLPNFLIGPLNKYSLESSTSLIAQDHSCMIWLEKQAPKSVIYVSFGSLASMKNTELMEIAWGLANSMHPFLWVIRPGSVHGSGWVELPNGFEEKTWERGLVVKWAPQQEVLAHPSVGGFWTHNGWNSTLESLCEGVPMLCSPLFGDQKVNARFVSHVWRVGVQLENGFDRGEIEGGIKILMDEKEGEEMRERIKIVKENAEICLRKGGSSHESMNRLEDHIMSL